MKHTARPVTLNARYKKATSPAKTTNGSEVQGEDGNVYTKNQTSNTPPPAVSASATADANTLGNVAAQHGDMGKAPGGAQATDRAAYIKTIQARMNAKGATIDNAIENDWADESARKELKDGPPLPSETGSKSSATASATAEAPKATTTTSYKKKMSGAAPARTGDQMYAWEKRNVARGERIAGRQEMRSAKKSLRLMEKAGQTVKGEAAEGLSAENKANLARYKNVVAGHGIGGKSVGDGRHVSLGNAVDFNNRGVQTNAVKDSHERATNQTLDVNAGKGDVVTTPGTPNVTANAKANAGYNAAKNSKMASGSGISPGVGGDYALDVNVSNPAQAPKASTAVSNKPTTLRDKRKFNKARKNEASMDAQSEVATAKMATSASAPSKGAKAIKTTNSTPDIKRSNMKVAKQEAARNVEAAKSAQHEKSTRLVRDLTTQNKGGTAFAPKIDIPKRAATTGKAKVSTPLDIPKRAPSPGMSGDGGPSNEIQITGNKPAPVSAPAPEIQRSNPTIEKQEVKRAATAKVDAQDAQLEEDIANDPSAAQMRGYKMGRSHSSKSPAKMWGEEGDVKKHSPAGQAKIDKATKSASDARWAKAKPASTPSPAKMWGPSKVKAGQGGFNRKK